MPVGPLSHVGQTFTLSMSGMDSLPLHAGEIVTAEVLHTGPGGTATIRLGNAVQDVRTEVPLQQGAALTLRIERQENAVYLRLAGNPEQSADVARTAVLSALNDLGPPESAAEAMSRLIALLKQMPAHIQENLPEIDILSRFLLRIDHLSGATLRDVVRNGGIFFESKLRILALGMEADGTAADIEAGRIIAGDLKASLLRLKDTFLSPVILQCISDSVRAEDLISALNTVLRNIEFCQLQSKLTDTLWLFLPLVWDGLRDGEIILRESDQGRPIGRSYSCGVHLDLERTGKIRVRMLFQSGYVHVTCAAENAAFSEVLRDGANALERQFRSAGLRLGNLAVVHQPAIHFVGPFDPGLSIHA